VGVRVPSSAQQDKGRFDLNIGTVLFLKT